MLSDFRRSVRLELIGRSADILFFTLLVIQKELSSPNRLRRLHYLRSLTSSLLDPIFTVKAGLLTAQDGM